MSGKTSKTVALSVLGLQQEEYEDTQETDSLFEYAEMVISKDSYASFSPFFHRFYLNLVRDLLSPSPRSFLSFLFTEQPMPPDSNTQSAFVCHKQTGNCSQKGVEK